MCQTYLCLNLPDTTGSACPPAQVAVLWAAVSGPEGARSGLGPKAAKCGLQWQPNLPADFARETLWFQLFLSPGSQGSQLQLELAFF